MTVQLYVHSKFALFDLSSGLSLKYNLYFLLQIILDLLHKDGPPDSRAIQTLINKLKVSSSLAVRRGTFFLQKHTVVPLFCTKHAYETGILICEFYMNVTFCNYLLCYRRMQKWRNLKQTSWCWSRICLKTQLKRSASSRYLNLLSSSLFYFCCKWCALMLMFRICPIVVVGCQTETFIV